MKIVELLLLFAAVLAPQFLLANSISSDEFIKSGSGAALGGVVVAAYTAWQRRSIPSPRE